MFIFRPSDGGRNRFFVSMQHFVLVGNLFQRALVRLWKQEQGEQQSQERDDGGEDLRRVDKGGHVGPKLREEVAGTIDKQERQRQCGERRSKGDEAVG